MVAPLEKSFRCILCHLLAATAVADSFVNPPSTERDQSSPLPPQEAALGIRLPDGFRATVFAAEPDVQQPIAMALDARGRLWVAECYTYAESRVNFDLKLRDRVVIFTDTDKDGRFDTRKVFWDKGERLTSIELGFGGLWATCAPNILFIPDKDGDDVPDGEAEIVLDGFDAGHVRHNIVNGLRWGPDGWLYGRHGIQNYSFVGKPGAPEREAGVRLGQRTKLSCCIWRIHPIRRTFEVVAEGTTNSWGHDWNELGDGFFTNTVIGHLWHLIPGAHYRRMYGEDLNPHVYQLLEQCADHFHWDTGEDWTKSRASETGRVSKKNDTLGGGHAHCGCLIYQGDMFPPEWRGKVLTLNFHGRRINVDRLEPRGSGYVGRHEPDFAFFADPWFRGIDLIQAPDGSIYVADWSDAGECHDNDGVHRTSGRIFRIAYQPDNAPKNSAPRSAVPDNVAALKESELIALQLSSNEWLVRTARRVLQERAAAGAELGVARASLIELFAAEKTVSRKLRLLWALAAVNAPIAVSDDLASSHEDDAIIAWQILLDPKIGKKKPAILTALANRSPRVRLSLLAALQRLPAEERWPILVPLVAHKADASDPNLPLLAWYWLAPLAGKNLDALAGVAHQSAIPQVTRLIARRVAEEIDQQPQILERLLAAAVPEQADRARQIVAGMRQGLQGRQRAKKPSTWESFQAAIAGKGERQLEADLRDLSALFGDGKAVKEIRAVALDGSSDYLTRRAALQTLVESRDSELRPICEKTIGVRELAGTAARGLATFDDPAIATLLLRRLGNVWSHDRPALISALVSRPTFAKLLLDAVGEGQVARQELTPFHARQIRAFNDESLTQQLAVTWGKVSESDEGKRALITKLKGALQPEMLKPANRDAGKTLFQQSCATCHRLFGEGNQIGPDLTGSDRGSLDYLLENIVDPNAIVPVDARMTVVTLKDGRVLSGMLGAKTDRTLTLRAMAGETHTLDRTQITSVEELPQSMMPEGLLQTLDQTQVRDLIAYLMTDAPTQ